MGYYKCCLCEKEFYAKHNSAICPECKNTPSFCVICGKEFAKSQPYTQKTCSPKCRGIYRAQSGIAKAGAVKMKQTKLDRYGSTDPNVVTIAKNGELAKRICPLCNKEFQPHAVRQVYCNDKHYAPCPVCGKLTEIKDYNIGVQACSDACRVARIQATCLDKYGNVNVLNSDHGKELARKTSLEKYGVEYYTQTEESKERYKQTIQDKYGVSAPIQVPEFRKKAKQTNLEKYGTEWQSQSEEVKLKVRATQEEKYGGVGLASSELRDKAVRTNLERYGVNWGFANEEIKQKAIQSVRERYNVDNFGQSKEKLINVIIDPSKVDSYINFRDDPERYVASHYQNKPTVRKLCVDLGVSDTPIYDVLIKNNCKDIVDRTKISNMEQEVKSFLDELNLNCSIVVNDREQIKPLELDFYLPDYNFAIECNPTSTHNSSVSTWVDGEVKPYNYHKNKSELAEKKGIFLFHIFGYEWINKRSIVESMIRNILGKCSEKIFARDTYVSQIDSIKASEFLEINHRQGSSSSKIRLGLVSKTTQELVSLMTFGKTRTYMGRLESDSENTYELIRFCSKLNTSVVGGASKLFQYFVNNYHPDKVISFSDIAHTRGKLYSTLGFIEKNRSDPGYIWVRLLDEFSRSRVSCQKRLLPELFEDVSESDIHSKSEREIMLEHGYVQVYDSGVIRWEYTPNAE